MAERMPAPGPGGLSIRRQRISQTWHNEVALQLFSSCRNLLRPDHHWGERQEGVYSEAIFNRKVRQEVAKIAKGQSSIYKNVAYLVPPLRSLRLP